MASSVFSVTEHIIPSQHIREYAHAVKDEYAPMQLVVKEYRPLSNLEALKTTKHQEAWQYLRYNFACYHQISTTVENV
jgi:hypothetical protein